MKKMKMIRIHKIKIIQHSKKTGLNQLCIKKQWKVKLSKGGFLMKNLKNMSWNQMKINMIWQHTTMKHKQIWTKWIRMINHFLRVHSTQITQLDSWKNPSSKLIMKNNIYVYSKGGIKMLTENEILYIKTILKQQNENWENKSTLADIYRHAKFTIRKLSR